MIKRESTCTTMIKLQMVNMPLFPSVSKNSCPIGKGRSEFRRSVTDLVANDAAMKRSHPND